MPTYTQKNRPLAVTTPLGEDKLLLTTFNGSEALSQPFSFQLGGHVIPGWNKGLVGVPVGSRVMLVIPPADGYGKTGSPQAHIKGTDTLVFVVDILGAFGASPG